VKIPKDPAAGALRRRLNIPEESSWLIEVTCRLQV
jgi:hypothetical protein